MRNSCRGVALLLVVLSALAFPGGQASAADAPAPRQAAAAVGRPASIAISYADLLDPDAITRSGKRLVDAVRDPRTPRAHLQPFLDGYTFLLPAVVEMVRGADPVPRKDVLERWPAGSRQPAWVALFREGNYRALADGEGRVTLFLPGDEAAAAWRKHYPVVRHCLAALAAGGSPLSVEIFAYRNDYRKQELRLDLRPALVAGASFPPDRAPLDLTSLEDFFRGGGRLEGAQLDPDEGLVLFANPEHRDSFAGEQVSLADLAVAYRAYFHAGDNEAFVSLDPGTDPSLATVNFGGHLEDTRLGATILAADRRFKTVCSGLDPVSFRDAREETRKHIPTFLTNSERGFIDGNPPPPPGWVGTRYWFYPESISVDYDPDDGLAVITRPQFTADAERVGKGFEGADARRKRAVLSFEIRENIRNINAYYDRYAAAFPEFGDLSAVARLMAISAWLRRSDTSRFDLDALLSVELPAASTPRTLEQIISAEYITVLPSEKITEEVIKRRSGVTWLTPMLRRTVGDFFGAPTTLARYLCTARKAERLPCSAYEAEAATLFEAARAKPLRSLLRSSADLMALLEFLTSKIEYPPPPEVAASQAEIAAAREQLERLRAELAEVKAAPKEAGESSGESLAGQEQRERIETEIDLIMKRFHEGKGAASNWRTKSNIQVTGGISLRPGEFTIRKSVASPALQKFRQMAKGASAEANPAVGIGRLVRSRPTGKIPRAAVVNPLSAPAGRVTGKTPSANAPAAAAAHPAAAVSPNSGVPKTSPPPVAAAESPGVPTLMARSVSIPGGAPGAARVVGEMAADGRITFRKVSP